MGRGLKQKDNIKMEGSGKNEGWFSGFAPDSDVARASDATHLCLRF